MQQHVLAVSPNALFLPCMAHSLNLVGTHSVKVCDEPVISFFGLLQAIYNFFSASPSRWAKLFSAFENQRDKKVRVKTLKSLSDTRWSARADAVDAVFHCYSDIVNTLEQMSANSEQKAEVVAEARAILQKLRKLETGILTAVWHNFLSQINRVNLALQDPKLDFATAVSLMKGLLTHLSHAREEFKTFEQEGIELSAEQDYISERNPAQRNRKRKRLDGEPAYDADNVDAELSPSDKFRINVFYVVVDKLQSCLSNRLKAYEELEARFGFLSKGGNEIEDDALRVAVENIERLYPHNFKAGLLFDEYHQYLEYVTC